MAGAPRRGTFAFELSKPNKKGTLMKQGALHKAFKYRFFVLYPGFLVYYDTENKWKVDLAKGETLGNRIGAIKLKNGSVSVARDAPKGCKFGLIVYAPDPVNKRQSYLLNALNKGDRDDWIEAIKSSIPRTNSPRQGRKEKAPRKEEVRKEESLPPHPPSALRQDTATAAALLASEEGGNDKETSIDSQLQGEPSITVRHNTANVAALLASGEAGVGKGEGEEEGAEGEEEIITSFDEEAVSKVLGQKENGRDDSSDEGSDVPLSPEPTEAETSTAGPSRDSTSPATVDKTEEKEKESALQVVVDGDSGRAGSSVSSESAEDPQLLETERKVESSMNIEGKVEVVTSVKVIGNGKDNEQGQEENGDITRNGTGEERRGSEVEVEVAVKGSPGSALTITMLQHSDSTSSDSEDEGHPASPTSPPIPDTPSSIPDTPSSLPDTPSSLPDDSSSDARTSVSSSEPGTPAITIDKVSTLRRIDETTMAPEEEEEAAKRLAAKGHKRRSSAPFIEKRGFLYKEGGHRKTWKMRYFVLQPGSFTYYKTNPNTKPLGEVKLKNLQIRFPGAGQRKQSFQFTIHTESSWNKRPDYVLAAQSDAELKEWIAAFKLAGQKNTSPSPSPPGSDEETVPNGTIPVSS